MKQKIFLTVVAIAFIFVCLFSSVSAAELNLLINAKLSGFNTDFRAVTNPSALVGIDGFDAAAPTTPSNYSQFYSSVSTSAFSVDAWPASANPRTLHLVYNTNPLTVGILVLSWNLSGQNYSAILQDYGTDSNYAVPVGNSINMQSIPSYTASSNGLRYFTLTIDSINSSSSGPQVNIIGPENATYLVASIPVNVTLDRSGSCVYNVNGGTSSVLSANLSSTGFNGVYNAPNSGSYLLLATCIDTLGNSNSSSVRFSVNLTQASNNNTGNSGSGTGTGGSGTGTGTGGSTTTVSLFSLKIITPAPISVSRNATIRTQITVLNDGQLTLRGISFDLFSTKNDFPTNELAALLDINNISVLNPGQSKNLTLSFTVNSDTDAEYAIKIDAHVSQPFYDESAKVFVTTSLNKPLSDKLLLTQNLIISNPECSELKEDFDQAQSLYNAGNMDRADQLLNSTIAGCRRLISDRSQAVLGYGNDASLLGIVAIVAVVLFVAVFIIYYMRRRSYIEPQSAASFTKHR